MQLIAAIGRLRRDTKAVALTEFALSLPLVLTASLYGLEAVNLAVTTMKLNQAAVRIADDASRIGESSVLDTRKIYEHDIVDLLIGADLQFGEGLDLYGHGRVILSSQEIDPDDGTETQQYIHWQRCMGMRNSTSAYGDAGTGKGDPSFKGMGPVGEEVKALPEDAVMFVEIFYDYQPLVTDAFVTTTELRTHASFTVRSMRDLSQIYQRDPANPSPVAACDRFERFRTDTVKGSNAGNWNWDNW